MAKKIDRARVEAGRVELPKKLAFLTAEKVDFSSVTDKDGDWSVELPAAALQKLVKSRNELKAVKADHKKAAAQQASLVDAEKAAHEETRQALAKAERRIKALEKKLAGQTADGADTSAPKADKRTKPVEQARVPKKVSGKKPTLPVDPVGEPVQAADVAAAS
ncbi:hypothetical protein [Caldimonas brevitalea]|uniref:Uncharacterized protein n=1 Tax=Caldimonas brevitalea TaxID=413882 RepID=A0A0G3BN64_9BURK|nr:hypothetical protein [Caldimonas brevitalea]AKJ29433.1 hypothetical protein AAW51_2742 [Caldimonas brevitalea]